MGKRTRTALIVVAGAYLATVFLDGTGTGLPSRLLPRPWVYFAQVSALFPSAATASIEYRAEGWSCTDRKWIEVDVRPFFRIDADNKENRFERAVQFYRRDRTVMRALEEFVVTRWNAGGDRTRIGGVRFLSLRVPLPKPGDHIEPSRRRPISDFPGEQHHHWYWTPRSKRLARCGHEKKPDDIDDDGSAPADTKDQEP